MHGAGGRSVVTAVEVEERPGADNVCLHGELVKASLLKAKHATQTPVVSSRCSYLHIME